MRALPDGTAKLLRAIDALPAAKGLVLAGGTALALRIAHRRSADLDFVFAAARLPGKRIDALLDALRKRHDVKTLPNVAAEQEFLDSGLELTDYQRDYAVDGVKLTFFVPEPTALGAAIRAEAGVAGLKRALVADLPSLFLMKSVALNQRIALRDFFDVYTLIEGHGQDFGAVLAAANRYGHSADTLKTRLIAATRSRDDPGVEPLAGPEPSFEKLKAYFANAIDRVEQAAAATAFRGEN